VRADDEAVAKAMIERSSAAALPLPDDGDREALD
jgi:hypothetical protein